MDVQGLSIEYWQVCNTCKQSESTELGGEGYNDYVENKPQFLIVEGSDLFFFFQKDSAEDVEDVRGD